MRKRISAGIAASACMIGIASAVAVWQPTRGGNGHSEAHSSAVAGQSDQAFVSTVTNQPSTTSSPASASTSPRGAAINKVMAALSDVVNLDIGQAPPGACSDMPSTAVWLDALVRASGTTNGEWIHGAWESDLAQADIAEMSGNASNLAATICGSTINAELPNGRQVDIGGGASDTPSGRVFSAATQSDAVIESDIRKVISSFGLSVSTIEILRPMGPAVDLVVTAKDISAIEGKVSSIEAAIVGSPSSLEGLYLEVRLGDGSVILRNSIAYRANVGRLWINPDVTVNLGIDHA